MEHSLGDRGDEREDEADLIDAFFLPGGILDPEDDTGMGYKDNIPYEDNDSFLRPLPSPVYLNPWETAQPDSVDAAVDWKGTHSPSSPSHLPETLLPALSPPRQLRHLVVSKNPCNYTIRPTSVIVPPPGFHRSTSENAESIDIESSLMEDNTNKTEAPSSIDQVKKGKSTSFADVIRCSPPATFATQERKITKRPPSHYSNTEKDEKSHEIELPKPQTRSSSPPIRNGTARPAPNFHMAQTKQTSNHVVKATVPSTEWNHVDRNPVGRSDNAGSPAVRERPSFEQPVLLFDDSDDDNHNRTESSSEPLCNPAEDCNTNTSQTSQTVKPNGDTSGENDKSELSHAVTPTGDVDSFDMKRCKVVDSDESLQAISPTSFSEPSNVKKRHIASTPSETVSSEIFAVLVPLLWQLMVLTNYVAIFLWNLTQLIAMGARNVLIYASWEASLSDGALSCYLVLYTLPTICDWMMIYVSLPHFLPHVISTVSLCCLSRFPDQSPRTTPSRVSDEVCRLILNTFRFYLPMMMFLEGFRGPNSKIMLLDKSTRLVLAYFLSMLRTGLLFSPVGWFGWSIQVILSLWLPEGLLSSCILSLMGFALLRLMSVLPARKTASI